MYLRIIAILYGIAFIFCGVSGFLPTFTKDGLLFGYFEVTSMHNLIHIIIGVIAIMAATSYKFTKLFFQLFGIIFTIAGIWSFWKNCDLYIMHVNTADSILILVAGVIAIYLGFSAKKAQA